MRVLVTATNSGGGTGQVSNRTAKVTRLKPVLTAGPVISGTLKVGSVLTSTSGEWANVPASYSYTWKRCTSSALASCTLIAGANQATYELAGGDDVRYLRVTVTATNSGGSANSPSSARTSKVTRVKPVNTALPVISGFTYVGAMLSATTGEWDNVPASYRYEWKRCPVAAGGYCTVITGEDQSTYTLTAADSGLYIRVTVTATNSGGAARSPISNRTGEVTTPG